MIPSLTNLTSSDLGFPFSRAASPIPYPLFMALLSPKVDRQQPKEGREEDEEQAKTTLSEPDVTRTSVTIGPTLPRTF